MTPLPVRLAYWAVNTTADFLEAVMPANHPALCANCGALREFKLRIEDPAVGVTADPSHSNPLGCGDDPVGAPPPDHAPAGSPNVTAAAWITPAVLEVLAEHQPHQFTENGGIWCLDLNHRNHTERGDWDWQDWHEHVAPLISQHVVESLEALTEK